MFCGETLVAGIHVNTTWHELAIQTLLWTKYTPSSQQHYLMAVAPQQDNVLWHPANTAQEQLEERNKGPKVLTGPPNSLDPNLMEHV